METNNNREEIIKKIEDFFIENNLYKYDITNRIAFVLGYSEENEQIDKALLIDIISMIILNKI